VSYIRTVSDDDATGRTGELYEQERTAAGFVPNYLKAFALRPGVYDAWRQLAGAITSSMDPWRYELVTVAAATALRSSYCSLAHGGIMAEKFLTPDEVVQVVVDRDRSPLGATDRAIAAFAQKVALGAVDVTKDDVETLRQHGLADEEILDVALAAAARCFFSKVLDATGTLPDSAFAELQAPLRDVLTVGRPIAR
jgi:uncharacterized peroxidase-related enzyme